MRSEIFIVFLSCVSVCVQAEDPVRIATLRDDSINESSGLAASYQNPGCLWVHNDSGDKANLYLVAPDGRTRAVVHLRGVSAYDWEDMASFQIDSQPWLLVGDVGDNTRARGAGTKPGCRLLLVREPKIAAAAKRVNQQADVAVEIRFDYEDARWDCEAVAVDAARKEILLLTKGAPQDCGLYVLPLNLSVRSQSLTARRISSPFIPFVTGLDISSDGRTMAVGTMLNGVVIRRQPAESWSAAFLRPGKVIELPPRRQGETICFDRTGHYLILNSEEVSQPLWRIRVP